MQLIHFAKDEVIIEEGDRLKGIYLIRSGLININMRSSLFEQFSLQRLFPGCSYGTYAFFVDESSKHKRSKFSLQAISAGEYFFIRYNFLRHLGKYDQNLKEIIKEYRNRYKHYGIPECDFKVYRRKRNLQEIFVQALRRQVLLNKKKRSDIEKV